MRDQIETTSVWQKLLSCIKERRLPWRFESGIASPISIAIADALVKHKIRLLSRHHQKFVFLVPRHFALGDLLILSPIVRALKKKCGSPAIVCVSKPQWIDIVQRIIDFDHVISDIEFYGLEKEFDLKQVLRIPKDDIKNYNKDLIELRWEKLSPDKIEDKTISYKLNEREESLGKRYKDKYGDFIIFAPDCSSHSIKKRWIDGYWQRLIEMQSLPVITVGVSKEPLLNNCVDLRNKTTVHEMAALLKYCKLTVCLPSGPLWFARAFDKEAIVINGGYEPPVLTKYPKSRHLFVDDPRCSLCYARPNNECAYNFECMRKITPEMVDEEIKKILTNITR